jgi:hypothetical protein
MHPGIYYCALRNDCHSNQIVKLHLGINMLRLRRSQRLLKIFPVVNQDLPFKFFYTN